jgi:hypothetical protein
MDISEALTLASIPHTVDSRARYREIPETGPALLSQYVIGDESSDALSKVLELEECPLLFVSATGRVLVLRSGLTGAVALEAVDTPTEPQTEILSSIGKALYEIAKVPFKDFYSAPSSGRKKPKPEPPIESFDEEPVDADPTPEEIDTSEPTE